MPFRSLITSFTKHISRELLIIGAESLAIGAIFGGTFLWQDLHQSTPLQPAAIHGAVEGTSWPSEQNEPDETASPTLSPSPISATASPQVQQQTPKPSRTAIPVTNAISTFAWTPTPTPTPTILPVVHPCSLNTTDIEREVFAKTNEERLTTGAQALMWDNGIAGVAREHSLDMAEHGYFSHIDRANKTPWARAAKYGIVVSAENIGKWDSSMDDLAEFVDGIVSMWMASTGHRNNILGAFTKTGIGVVCSTNGYFITQEFR